MVLRHDQLDFLRLRKLVAKLAGAFFCARLVARALPLEVADFLESQNHRPKGKPGFGPARFPFRVLVRVERTICVRSLSQFVIGEWRSGWGNDLRDVSARRACPLLP